jgi:CTP synthase
MPDQRAISDMGGTMRLGIYPCQLKSGTKAAAAYKQPLVYERHRHRFELNNQYRDLLASAGMAFSGVSPDGRLVEITELRDHPWMAGCQFHPEFKSRPGKAHPLFDAFVKAATDSLEEVSSSESGAMKSE